jgi:hypothetical protein
MDEECRFAVSIIGAAPAGKPAGEDRNRTPFSVKLLRSLKYTMVHPEHRRRVGMTWASDGKTFFAYSRIFGEFLRLSASSINAIFRQYGFRIVENGKSDDIDLANVPKCRQWKRRQNLEKTMTTTEEESDQME